jgi:hypothetical protein
MPLVVERIRRAKVGLRTSHARTQTSKQTHFAGAGGNQVERVDGAALTDAIDTADALLDAHRIPRELEVDDEPAVMVKVETLRCRVGCQQQPERIAGERREHGCSLVARQAAVKHEGRVWERLADMLKRVPVLGEHHSRLTGAAQQSVERRYLRFDCRG